MARSRQIVGFGGGTFPTYGRATLHPLEGFVLMLTGRERPRVCYIPTASAEDPARIVQFHDKFADGTAVASHLKLFPWPREDVRDFLLGQDVIYVGGGNTANMLAIWRVHGIDRLLREAWNAGVVLCGGSAGMICWYEAAITDSFGPDLAPIRDLLGFLPGSACPHYDSEERRRPRYHELIRDGLPDGVAAEDGVGLHYVDRELREAVSARPDGRAYRVERAGNDVRESPIAVRALAST